MTGATAFTVEELKEAGRALKKNSRDALASDLKRFLLCGYPILCTTADLERYLADSAQGLNGNALAPVSLERFLASFRKLYRTDNRLKGLPDPSQAQSIAEVMAGIRLHYAKPPKQAGALSIEQLQALYSHLQRLSTEGTSELIRLTATRDWALMSMAFWRGLRADTLGAIRADAVIVEEGALSVFIPKEKQVKEHKGRVVRFEGWPLLNPVPAMKAWLAWIPNLNAMLFPAVHYTRGVRHPEKGMTRQQVTKLLRGRLEELGLESGPYSAHSFRHSLGNWGGMHLSVRDLMAQGGWTSLKSVEKYIQDNRRIQSLAKAVQREMELISHQN